MAYQALYRKWRPATFDDVVGQTHVVTTLKNEITAGKTAHAYLFCGTRGTGKTTCAKIFARAINCTNPKGGNPCNECEICRGVADGSILDVTEIDAASNNGVDNIREIRDEVVYSAAHAKYKIYIIDEVHMLSSGAFNALLKTLEEPPPHVVFILATTEAHKLPATITSRCQRFDFRRISIKDMLIRLKEITTAEGITADEEALELIARLADGALRDALSILDQCVSASNEVLTIDSAMAILGVASDEVLDSIVTAAANKDAAAAIAGINALLAGGRDLPNFIDMLIGRFRDIMVCAVSKTPDTLFEYSAHTVDAIKKQAAMFAAEDTAYILKLLCDAAAEAKWSKSARTIYEIAIMRMCDSRLSVSIDALAARIVQLEQQIEHGVTVRAVTPVVYQAPAAAAEFVDAAVAVSTVVAAIETNEEAEMQAAQLDDGLSDADVPWVEEFVEAKPITEVKSAVEIKPATEQKPITEAVNAGNAGAANIANSNAWNEVLAVLKKSSMALYGALSVKKAKLTETKLYLPNEAYLKAILSALSEPLADALKGVTGRDITVGFVSEAEFDEIKVGAVEMKKPIVAASVAAEEAAAEDYDEESIEEETAQEDASFVTYTAEMLENEEMQDITVSSYDDEQPIDSDSDQDEDDQDPLDSLFGIEGLNIEIEE